MEESMIGKKVKYCDETWEVIHIIEEKGEAVLNQICVDVDMGEIRVTPNSEIVKMDEITEIEHEMTAKEYTEKLKAVFGNAEKADIGADPCQDMNCTDCPFYSGRLGGEEYDVGCLGLVLCHPGLASKLIDEWLADRNTKKKPKRKTYLEDFREKMPNAYIDPKYGTPAACRKRMYYHETDDLKCGQKDKCINCWNEEMPEVSDNAEG